ncbi:hypothetical protein Tco_0231402 [Tanacetum coccineum]
MKKYDYGHLEEIEVCRDDQKLYTFKEGEYKRLRLQDIEDMLLLLVQQKAYTAISTIVDMYKRKRLMARSMMFRTALHDIAAGIRMEYLPMRNWSNLDKKRARVMVQDIDKQLYQRRLMRNLEKFVGRKIILERSALYATVPCSWYYFMPECGSWINKRYVDRKVTMEILLEPTSNKLLVGDLYDSIQIKLVTTGKKRWCDSI